MTDTRRNALTVIGVLLTVAGFYLRNAPAFPTLQGVVAPSYVKAQRALADLRMTGRLRAGQPGFDVVAKVFEDMIAARYPQVPRDSIALERIEAIGGGLELGTASATPVVRANFFFKRQQQPTIGNVLDAQPLVDAMWERRSLTLASILLWSGVLVSLTPIGVAVREARRAKSQRAPTDPPSTTAA